MQLISMSTLLRLSTRWKGGRAGTKRMPLSGQFIIILIPINLRAFCALNLLPLLLSSQDACFYVLPIPRPCRVVLFLTPHHLPRAPLLISPPVPLPRHPDRSCFARALPSPRTQHPPLLLHRQGLLRLQLHHPLYPVPSLFRRPPILPVSG